MKHFRTKGDNPCSTYFLLADADKVAEGVDAVVAPSPAPVPAVTAFAPSADTRCRIKPGSVALT